MTTGARHFLHQDFRSALRDDEKRQLLPPIVLHSSLSISMLCSGGAVDKISPFVQFPSYVETDPHPEALRDQNHHWGWPHHYPSPCHPRR